MVKNASRSRILLQLHRSNAHSHCGMFLEIFRAKGRMNLYSSFDFRAERFLFCLPLSHFTVYFNVE